MAPHITALLVVLAWVLVLARAYRTSLLDVHETVGLIRAKAMARHLHLGLVSNFEYVLYRAKLAVYELERLSINTTEPGRFLVFLEDRDFYRHHGISLKALLRAFLGVLRLKRRSGGSTITQQLVRTLFITEPTKLVRRKVTELLLALWAERVLSKKQILDLYLASVRFESGIYGLPDAMRFFFGHLPQAPSKAQLFFLIERVSNVRSRILAGRIRQLAMKALSEGLLDKNDLTELVRLYRGAVGEGRLVHRDGSLQELERLLRVG
jgi:penicillin-binding protein 1A